MKGPFRGSLTALPTPFRDGAVDFPALQRIVDFQLDNGTDGLVAAGSTGEGVVLSQAERLAVIEFTVGAARGRAPVLAGVGASDTRVACELAAAARRAGAHGLLVSTPAYNKPQQRGMVAHFGAVARASPLPLVLYNIPSRTGVDLLAATAAAIAREHASVVAIKEAGTSLARVKEHVELGALDVLLGEDSWIADGLALGAVGVIGVASNVVPALVKALVQDLLRGNHSKAPAYVERLTPLVAALFAEPNPAPLKHALAAMGLCRNELRLPLVPVESSTAERLRAALRLVGVTPSR
jgi:4-hydroxy-tetrahydrodipicolinate synthase